MYLYCTDILIKIIITILYLLGTWQSCPFTTSCLITTFDSLASLFALLIHILNWLLMFACYIHIELWIHIVQILLFSLFKYLFLKTQCSELHFIYFWCSFTYTIFQDITHSWEVILGIIWQLRRQWLVQVSNIFFYINEYQFFIF